MAGPSPALLSTLLSPHTSPSTIHLKLHPSPLLELLSSEYGLSIPLLASLPLDIRLYSFLASFTARAWGNPFFRPSTSQTLDERIAVNMLAAKEGSGCVLEWSCRGVNTGVPLKRGEMKKIVGRGLEGLRRTRTGVQVVGLKDVLSAVKMRSAVSVVTLPLETKLMPNTPGYSNLDRSRQSDTRQGRRAAPSLQLVPHRCTAIGEGGSCAAVLAKGGQRRRRSALRSR